MTVYTRLMLPWWTITTDDFFIPKQNLVPVCPGHKIQLSLDFSEAHALLKCGWKARTMLCFVGRPLYFKISRHLISRRAATVCPVVADEANPGYSDVVIGWIGFANLPILTFILILGESLNKKHFDTDIARGNHL